MRTKHPYTLHYQGESYDINTGTTGEMMIRLLPEIRDRFIPAIMKQSYKKDELKALLNQPQKDLSDLINSIDWNTEQEKYKTINESYDHNGNNRYWYNIHYDCKQFSTHYQNKYLCPIEQIPNQFLTIPRKQISEKEQEEIATNILNTINKL